MIKINATMSHEQIKETITKMENPPTLVKDGRLELVYETPDDDMYLVTIKKALKANKELSAVYFSISKAN